MGALSDIGFTSNVAFVGGFVSIIASLVTWLASRGKKDDKAQSDRWGIFIGHWAPTFFALGIALKLEESKKV
ncbi:hypothetical protein DDQ50_11375 [Amnibacterium flavum]|uniref:Uncharacterized protein n=1 Tax=Amnibacterium flavum TaxID=2173173 RepID=A0A2V1HQU3_9MICO|nr:hypothetical protein DDQ50_11375 [Amnibacterium flavum]